jgi:hypothetical protein
MQSTETPTIVTNRLSLISLSKDNLRAMIEKDYEKASQIGGFSVPEDYSVPPFRAERRLGMIEEDPGQWLGPRKVVHCGCDGFPAKEGSS